MRSIHVGEFPSRYPLIRAIDASTNQPQGCFFTSFPKKQFAVIGPTGYVRGSEQWESHLVYVALFPDGHQETFTPAAFRERFRWQNEPARAVLWEQR